MKYITIIVALLVFLVLFIATDHRSGLTLCAQPSHALCSPGGEPSKARPRTRRPNFLLLLYTQKAFSQMTLRQQNARCGQVKAEPDCPIVSGQSGQVHVDTITSTHVCKASLRMRCPHYWIAPEFIHPCKCKRSVINLVANIREKKIIAHLPRLFLLLPRSRRESRNQNSHSNLLHLLSSFSFLPSIESVGSRHTPPQRLSTE